MKTKTILVLLFAVFLIFSCQKENSTEPADENIHPQQDIPWPSLADSPWPMHHGDPQSTGRSSETGPSKGAIDWEFDVDGIVGTSIAIGKDSTIYFGGDGPYLYALNWNGTLKWKIALNENFPQASQASSPLVANDGTIYIGTRGKLLYAINPDGTVKWTFQADDWLNNLGMNIGLDGTIYFSDASFSLYAVNPDGNIKWKLAGNYKFQGIEMSGIAFSPDGSTLYLGCLGTSSSDTTTGLIAVGIDGSIKWLFRSFPAYGTPLVDNEGNIYFGARKSPDPAIPDNENKRGLFSITSNCKLRWHYQTFLGSMMDPAMDNKGNLFFSVGETPATSELISFSPDGKVRWKYSKSDDVTAMSSIVCDKNGAIYFATYSGLLLSFSSQGALSWKIKLGEVDLVSPALAYGRCLIGTEWQNVKGKLFCIK